MRDKWDSIYPISLPYNPDPKHWLLGDPERATVSCRIEQHSWITVPQAVEDYVICDDCGKRKDWTAESLQHASFPEEGIEND